MSKDEPSEPFTRVLGGIDLERGGSREGGYYVERRGHLAGENQQVEGHLEAQVAPGHPRSSTGVLPLGRDQPERGVIGGCVDWLAASKLRTRLALWL